MIRIAIVEDELIYMNQIKKFLEQYQAESGKDLSIQWFQDGEDIVEDYQAEYDIIFLDIQMQFMDGMTAAEKIRQMDQEVIIMFITNMVQYALKGYEVDALDYIVKPVTYFAFSQKLDRAIMRLKKKETHYLTIPVQGGVQKVEIPYIFYVESQGHSLIYVTNRGEYLSKGKMKDMEELLTEYGFFRSNKGYLVNLNHVDGIKNGCCLIHGQELLISRTRRADFMEALTKHLTGGEQ